MTAADLLRRAARLVRETARGGQPWHLTGRSVSRADGSEVAYSALHAAHIALWSPPVALAVAGWLEQHAEVHEDLVDGCRWLDHACEALAVARALAGEQP